MSLDAKKIVVTGGAGGIGALVVKELLARGADVLVVDRVPPPAANARYANGDLSTMDGVDAVAAEIAHEQPDILINLAGLQFFGPMEQEATAHLHASYMVNLIAPVVLTQAVLPAMKYWGSGQIVNIGSIFGSIGYPHFVAYSSAKAGLRGFSEALRRELRGSGVDVTYIAPRAVRTGLSSAKVMRFAELTRMTMDEPETVASKIVQATIDRKKDVYVGFPERFFVLVNALAPRLVDVVLMADTAKARQLFTP
jgi:short-subunit dehydrogenase